MNGQDANDDRNLVLSVDRHRLGDFISGLLGQRRSIERAIPGRRFVLDMNWFLNLDQIVSQRIAAQNAGELVSFSGRVFFSDGRIITLADRQSFAAFNDLSNSITIGADIHWTYLIAFPLKNVPEKQEIRFKAFTDRTAVEEKPSERLSRTFLKGASDDEELFYSIQFSDVTWGEDVSTHIGKYVEGNTERSARISSLLRRVPPFSLISFGTVIAMFLMMFDLTRQAGNSKTQLMTRYGIDPSAVKLPNIETSLNFLVDLEVLRITDGGLSSVFLLLVKLLFYTMLIALAFAIFSTRKASFISLNSYSKKYYENYNTRYELIKYGIVLALAVGIVGGIFSNRIYDAVKLYLY